MYRFFLLGFCLLLKITPAYAAPVFTDFQNFNEFWDAAQEHGEGIIPAGTYSSDEVWDFHARSITTVPTKISAYGAIKNGGTVILAKQRLVLEGLTVKNSSVCYHIVRGQGSRFSDLTAENCTLGFAFMKGKYANSQVTYSLFQNLLATKNGIGFYFNTNADVGRSWINANTFVQMTSRSNGFGLVMHDSTTNYNTFIGLQMEGNLYASSTGSARANTFIGSHIVEGYLGGLSLLTDPGNFFFGGRIVGEVSGNPHGIFSSKIYGLFQGGAFAN